MDRGHIGRRVVPANDPIWQVLKYCFSPLTFDDWYIAVPICEKALYDPLRTVGTPVLVESNQVWPRGSRVAIDYRSCLMRDLDDEFRAAVSRFQNETHASRNAGRQMQIFPKFALNFGFLFVPPP